MMFENLNPLDKSTAVIEIVIMLLVAFILGFILAWILKRSRTSTGESSAQQTDDLQKLRMENDQLRKDLDALNEKGEGLQKQLADCESEKKSLISARPEPLPQERNVSASDAENAQKLGFKAVTADRKDDLTKIKGVGPFIEAKLNGLGIYTFEQISEFTPDTVEKVTIAIEFFPGRIERDKWVVQASQLK